MFFSKKQEKILNVKIIKLIMSHKKIVKIFWSIVSIIIIVSMLAWVAFI